MADNSNKRRLYDALVADDYDMGSYEQFCKDVMDDGKRRKLYDAISGEYDLPDYAGFSRRLVGGSTKRTWLGEGAEGWYDSRNSLNGSTGNNRSNGKSSAATAQSQKQPQPQGQTARGTTQPTQTQQSAAGQPQGSAWRPTMQERIRMMEGARTAVQPFGEWAQGQTDAVRRNAERNTPESRQRQRAAHDRAVAAGLDTRLTGLGGAPRNVEFGMSNVESGQSAPDLAELASPVVYDTMEDEQGRTQIVWLMPDGRLTSDRGEAEQGAMRARQTRLMSQFVDRMRANGLDPSKRADVQMQEQEDARAPMRRAVEMAWSNAEDASLSADDAYNKEVREHGMTLRDAIASADVSGMHVTPPSTRDVADMRRRVSHKKAFDLRKMTDDAWANLPEYYRDEMIEAYAPSFKGDRKRAEAALRDELSQMLYGRLVGAKRPKNTGEFVARKIGEGNLLSNDRASEVAASAIADSYDENIARNAAMAQYGEEHPVADIVGTVAGMAADPITYVSGGVGSAAGKMALGTVARTMAGRSLKGATMDVAKRVAGSTLGGRLAAGMVGGGANFGTYEMGKNIQEQIYTGGVADYSTGKRGDYSLGAVLGAGGRGVVLGTAMGAIAPVTGNVADRVVGKVGSTVGKAGVRAAQGVTNVVAEGTVFAMPEWISGNADWMDAWSDGMATALGFKVSHAIKSVPRTIDALRPKKDARGRVTDGMDFEQRLRERLNGAGKGMALTEEEMRELRDNGYGGLADLFGGEHTKTNGKVHLVRGVDGTWNMVVRDGEGVKERPEGTTTKEERASARYAGNVDMDGYDAMRQLMADGRVSEAARAKCYWILTGRTVPMSTVAGWQTEDHGDGTYTVRSVTVGGDVVTARRFKNKRDAEGEEMKIRRQAEYNTVEVGERYAGLRVDAAAAEDVAKEYGTTAEAVRSAAANVEVGKGTAGEQEIYKRYGEAMEAKRGELSAEAIRKRIEDETNQEIEAARAAEGEDGRATLTEREVELLDGFGKDGRCSVDAILGKSPDKRTQAEQAVVERYLAELYPEGMSNEGTGMSNDAPAGPSGPMPPGGDAPEEWNNSEGLIQGVEAKPRGMFEYFRGTLSDLVGKAKSSAQVFIKKVLSPVSPRLKEDLANRGVVIDDEYNHVIDSGAIRHIFNRHSSQKTEESRGQLPITDADFGKITDVVENYDTMSVEGGRRNTSIVYSKTYEDGTTIYVEEVRVGRKELAAVSMWKKKSPSLTGANRTDATQIPDLQGTSGGKGTTNAADVQGQAEREAARVRAMAEAEAALEDAFAGREDLLADAKDDPWETLRDPELTAEQRDAVVQYLNNVEFGMSNVESDVPLTAEVAQATARRVNHESGMVVPARVAPMQDVPAEDVYIVSGEVRMQPDGSGIDRGNSDSFIVVCDAEGNYHATSPDRLESVGEAVTPEQWAQRMLNVEFGMLNDSSGNTSAMSNVETGMSNDSRTGSNGSTGNDGSGDGATVRSEELARGVEAAGYDVQGNPVDEQGRLVVESVGSMDEITDADFDTPTRNVQLPDLPENVSMAIGSGGKPIVIKRSVFEKNRDNHPEIDAAESRSILERALYNPDLVGSVQARTRPDYRVAIQTGDRNAVVVLDIYDGKDNTEIVGWREINERGLERMRRQAAKDDGQLIILSPSDKPGSAAALSTLQDGLSSEDKGSENAASAQEAQGGALSRVPTDAKGEPMFEQAEDASTAWDALVEYSGGDVSTAKEIAEMMAQEKRKAYERAQKLKPKGKTPAEILASKRDIEAERARTQAEYERWQQMGTIMSNVESGMSNGAGTQQTVPMQPTRVTRAELAEEAEARRAAAEQAERERAERAAQAEADRLRLERLNGVPDWRADTPEHARARGYRRSGPEVVERQGAVSALRGKAVRVKFAKDVTEDGVAAVIDVNDLQPSHVQGVRNVRHFIPEAQPKDRKDAVSKVSAQDIARDIRPEEITGSITAYTGAPSVNSRGETIQGNSRADALKWMYDGEPEQAAKYKAYLVEHAEDFGMKAEDIEAMERPVLVNMLDVDDGRAIRLGQYVQSDTESGGVERIRGRAAARKMGADIRQYAERLLSSEDEDASISQLIASNGVKTLQWMNTHGYITDTQYASCFDRKGELTGAAAEDLKDVLYQGIFEGGSVEIEEMFAKLPAKAQRAILATAYRDYDSVETDSIRGEIQQAIVLYNEMMMYPQYAGATNIESALTAVAAWSQQYAFDDASGESYLPAERFSNFALHLAAMYKGMSQRGLQKMFNDLYDTIQGVGEDTLFESAEHTPHTIAEAVKKVLGIEYKPAKGIKNGEKGHVPVADGSEVGATGRRGSTTDVGGRERVAGTGRADERGGGTVLRDAERGGQGDIPDAQRRQQGNLEASERIRLSDEIDENGRQFVLTSKGELEFGEIEAYTGLTPAPILLSEGLITNAATNDGYGLVHIEARHGDQIRKAGFKSVVDFVEMVAKNYDVIKEGNQRDGHQTYRLQLTDKHNNTLMVELSADGTYWKINTAGIFKTSYGKNNKEVYNRHATVRQPAVAAGASQGAEQGGTQTSSSMIAPTSSGDKVTNSSEDKQYVTEKSSVAERVAAASADVNTEPTEAQKEAGNYKKGHVQVGTFDITIEQPEGSVRKGTDANGKQWESKMHNTYGYFRGTEGVDGDHIDVFLSNDIDGWNGRKVYVVDQYNPDGTFDEHKVMLGFNDADEAKSDYLANYEKGWEDGRRIDVSTTNLEDFENWIGSSHRKTKPFAEYAGVKKETVGNASAKEEATPTKAETKQTKTSESEGYTITPSTYTNKKGKTSDVSLLTFDHDLTADQERAVKEFAKERTGEGRFAPARGWKDRESGGWIFRSEEDARKAAEMVGSEEAVADNQPLTAQEMRDAVEPKKPAARKKTTAKKPANKVEVADVVEQKPTEPSKPIKAAEPAKEEKPQYEVSDEEMNGLMNDIRDILGIGDDEGDVGLKFRDPDELTAEQRQKLMSVGQRLAMAMVERGNESFKDYASMMVKALGNKVRPWLKAFYGGLEYVPGYDKYALTPYEEVKAFDVENFDKPQHDVLAQANMIVEEGKAQVAANKANNELKEIRNEQRKETEKQTAADTDAVAAEAETVASEAESLAETSSDEQALNGAAERVDDALDKVSDQLALLGYYEADHVGKDFNEAYGYMRNAEKKAVKDAANLASQLIDDLGLNRYEATHGEADKKGNRKTKPLAVANIAPAGGDVTMHLPLAEGRELYVNIQLAPSAGKGEIDDRGDNLTTTGIMFRVESENGYVGENRFLPADVTYSTLLEEIRKHSRWGLSKQDSDRKLREMAKMAERGESPYVVTSNVEKGLARQRAEAEYRPGDKVQYTPDGLKWHNAVVHSVDEDGVLLDAGQAPVLWVSIQLDQLDQIRRPQGKEDIFQQAERVAAEARQKREGTGTDNQGNPLNADGTLKVERVSTISDITDGDFTNPKRNVVLPPLPAKVDEAIGANGKDVVIKKSIFEKNRKNHGDLTAEQSREILSEALYHPDLYGQNQKTSRPYNWILIHNAEKHSSVILEVSHGKDNVEIVNWHYLDDTALRQKERQAVREDGLILTLESAAGDTQNGLSSEGKGTTKAAAVQEKGRKVEPEQPLGGLFAGLFDEPKDNGLQGNDDAVRTEAVPADNSGQQQGLRESQGSPRKAAAQESGRPDGGRGGQGTGKNGAVPAGLHGLTEPKNTRNNHSERGADHAPTSVNGRIEANIKAIELAHELLESGETATSEQMRVLRQFSGWGGLGAAFNYGGYDWKQRERNKKIRELLGEEAYEQAVMSANSAYYTPAYVVDTLWDIAKQLGFKGGNILEGSAGIGNILGQMPTTVSERSDIHAIEIDGTSGGILSLLYPDAKVDIQGFEQTRIPNGSVDLAITNVPFVTGLRVNDTTGDSDLSKKFHNIHDFCIAKNVRKLREGGLGIFISSNGTLDGSKALRDWVVNEGGSDFIGAFRMNNKTFGGTTVTSDIIVIRKRVNGQKSSQAIDVSTISGERTAEYEEPGARKAKQLSMDYNKYFIEHPDHMAGEMRFAFEEGDTFRPTSKGLYPVSGKDQGKMLADFVKSFTEETGGSVATTESAKPSYVSDASADGKKLGEMYMKDGKLVTADLGGYYPLEVNDKKIKGHTKPECFNAYAAIKTALADVMKYQTENEDNAGLKPLIAKLNKAYDDFVNTYGHFNKNNQLAWLRNDVDYPNVFSLETYNEQGDGKGGVVKTYGKADVMKDRVVEKESEPHPENVKDGVVVSMFKNGRIDVPYIAGQLGKSEEAVKREIIDSGLGFEDPATRQMEVSYQYLSGNVREKLRQAEANNENGEYTGNIKALQEVVPMNIPAHLIDFTLGSSWLDPKLYDEYVKDRTDIDVHFTAAGGTWFMKAPTYGTNVEKNRAMGIVSEMLKKTIMGHELIAAAIQNKGVIVSRTEKHYDGTTETITDREATAACAAKIDEIRQDFKDWARQKMQSDADLSVRMETEYNDRFNNYVPMSIPDDFVPEYFGGATHKFKMRPHQGKAIVRGTMQPLLLAHEVGTGKTFTLISTAMEMRRLGTARKPMIVVQNATVGQFAASAKELYPNAKILTLEDNDRNAEGRKNFYAKIKYNDWDMIVVPQSTFEFIPDSDERQMQFVQDKIDEKMLVLEKMREADTSGRDPITRRAEKELADLQAEMAALSEGISKKRTANNEKKKAVAKQNAAVKAQEMLNRRTDDVENFDDMGIDALLIDEAHEYKHLGFATAMQRGVKGVDPSYSKKSQGVYLKTQAILEKNNGRNVIFATGTPISNTAAEIWTFMRYLMPKDTMKEYGIYYFDDFVRNFGNLQQMMEFSTSGKFKEVNRFAGYVNLPELVRIWSGAADTVLTKDQTELLEKIPEMEGGKAQDIYLPQTRALRSVMKYVRAELDRFDKMSGKEKKENSSIPLTMYGIAQGAAVDARLVEMGAEDDANSKTNEAVRQTLRSLKETDNYKGTVAIFADHYQNKRSGFNLYEDIRQKLIARGVPADEVVVMKPGMTIKKKLEIFDKVNRGEVRVILGSTATLGTGVNIQERLHTLIHLDAPNRPMDYTQRNGRILRQGNLHKDWGKPVRVLRFGVEDSLDVTAYQRLKTKGAIADSVMEGDRLMQDSMNNRVLEEEEDVFGDTVAQLSGSEYALLKNNAEKNVRKYESRKKQWEADQTYIHNAKPKLEGQIKNAEQRADEAKVHLHTVQKAFPDGKFAEIIIGKYKFGTVADMADFIKEYNKKILDAVKAMKENTGTSSQTKTLTLSLGGYDFVVKTEMSRETVNGGGLLLSEVHRKMTYSCPELGMMDVPVKQSLLRNAVEDITENVITGKDFAERLDVAERAAAHGKSELEQLKQREGKPFEFGKELEEAKRQLAEYTEAMKAEMAEKEKKYAEMDASVEAATDIVAEDEGETEEDKTKFRLLKDDVDGESSDPEVMAARARELAEAFKLPYRLITTAEELASLPSARMRRMLGVYNPGIGIDGPLVTIAIPNHRNVRHVEETVIHEGVHNGVSKALNAEERKGFFDFVYGHTEGHVREEIDVSAEKMREADFEKRRRKYGNGVFGEAQARAETGRKWREGEYHRDATEERTAEVTAKVGLKGLHGLDKEELSLWRWFKAMLSRVIAGVLKGAGVRLKKQFTDKDLAVFGWNFLKFGMGKESIFDKAKGVALRHKAGFEVTERGENYGRAEGENQKETVNLQHGKRLGQDNDEQWSRNGGRMAGEGAGIVARGGGRGDIRVFEKGLASSRGEYTVRSERDRREAESERLVDVAKENGLYIPKERIRDLGQRVSKQSRESEVYVNDDAGRVYKVKDPYASSVMKPDVQPEDAIYEHLVHNKYFPETAYTFEGITDDMGYVRIVLSQDLVRSTKRASARQVAEYLAQKGLRRIDGYHFGNDEVTVTDVEGDNTFIDEDGNVRIIDPVIDFKKPAREILDDESRDGGMKFRDGDDIVRSDKALARAMYEPIIRTSRYQMTEAFQDSMLGLKTLYKAVEKASGSNRDIADIPGYENAYLAENRMSSVVMEMQRIYADRYMKPLTDAVAKLAGGMRGKQRVIDYMMAKHGLERNAYMRKQAAENGEATERDFAGLTALTGIGDWALAEDKARFDVEDFEKENSAEDIEALWKSVNAATKKTLNTLYDGGIIGKDTYEQVRDMYEYYIPLRGWDEKTSDEVYAYLRQRGGGSGNVIKKAEGRASKADDPLVAIAAMAESAIMQAEKNKVKQCFLNYALAHPSDLVSVNRLWLQHDDVTDEWKPVVPHIDIKDTPEEIDRKNGEFEARMRALTKAEPDKYKRGRQARGIPYKVVKGNLGEHQVLVLRNGETYVVTINGNPRAAQGLNGLTNPDSGSEGIVRKALDGVMYVNRTLSSLYTTRNPEFVISNFMRDMLYANTMVWAKESPAYALRYNMNYVILNPGIMLALQNAYKKGGVPANGYQILYKEFRENGGETGFVQMKNESAHRKAIKKALKKAYRRKLNPVTAFEALGQKLDDINRAVENCARFAAYVTSRQNGRDIARSIWDAKEISVNFNKKGAGDKLLGAEGQTKIGNVAAAVGGAGRLLYVFWNAGIQGMSNTGKIIRHNPIRGLSAMASMFTIGAVIAALNAWDDEEDPDNANAYYNQPGYIRRSNIMFRLDDAYISIPLPIEFRAFYGLGELAVSVISGKEQLSDAELVKETASQVSQIFPIDMLEGGGGFHPFIPSLVKPIAEAYSNTSWTGMPIYREEMPWNENLPEWTRAYPSANQQLVGAAKWLNEATGGDDYSKGAIDINPARLEYMFNGYLGGYSTTVNKLVKMGETAFGERDFEWRNMLMASRLVKAGDERNKGKKLDRDYYRWREEYNETRRLLKAYEREAKAGSEFYRRRLEQLKNSDSYRRYQVLDKYRGLLDYLKRNVDDDRLSEDVHERLSEKYKDARREAVERIDSINKVLEQRR